MITSQEHREVHDKYNREKKSKTTMFLLWFFLGSFGAHNLYLKNYTSGFMQLILFYGGIILFSIGLGFLMMTAWAIWWFVNLFTNVRAVERYNWDLLTQCTREMEMNQK